MKTGMKYSYLLTYLLRPKVAKNMSAIVYFSLRVDHQPDIDPVAPMGGGKQTGWAE